MKRGRSGPPEENDSDEAWVERRAELMFAVGESHARIHEPAAHGEGWARSRHVLHEVFGGVAAGARVEVGSVRKIGHGMSRDVYAAEVALAPDPRALSGSFAVLVPRRDAETELDERTRREMRLLLRLREHAASLPFRIPEVIGVGEESGRLALVRRWVRGVHLDLRAGRWPDGRPWEVVGRLAAAVHHIEGAQLASILPGHATRRAHARAVMRDIEESRLPEVRDARAWIDVHLPPEVPSSLLHGDLLGQNILLDVGRPPALIDWEWASRGDPAADLAIVTRGRKRPFEVEGGLAKLLDAYERHGGRGVTAAHVHIHELAMLARWAREGLPGVASDALVGLRSLLRRCTSSM